jgi:hypothetical protein
MSIGLHVKSPLFLADFKKTLIFRKKLEKVSNMNFYKNPSSESQVVLWGQTDRQTDVRKQAIAFRNFAKVRNNGIKLQVLEAYHQILNIHVDKM